jgi:aldehyde dehydrogenase (NAD(P)+)
MLTTATTEIDGHLDVLAANADTWASLGISERVDYLSRVSDRVATHAAQWVDAAMAGKHIRPGSPFEGEEWISGPYPTLTWIREFIATLTAVDIGKSPLAGVKLRTNAVGRVAARVYPTSVTERLLLHGYDVEVWMGDDVTEANIHEGVADRYRRDADGGKVALVLGAGNISSIPPLDILYKLFADREVVVLKLNPINDHLGPVFEKIFAPLVDDGYLRFVYGAADVGAYLTDHALVDTVHITGSATTHDRIVFGGGDEGRRRKEVGEPRLQKAITSELGGVSPTIVVPGPWTDADIAFQAEHIVSQKLHNSGFNCVASQVLVLPEEWGRRTDLVDAITDAMHEAEDRHPYYPGTGERQSAASESSASTRHVGVEGRRSLITDVDASDHGHHCFREELFAPVLAMTTLPAPSAAEFLRGAVAFANERLQGTLGANIIIHPATAKELGEELERAIEMLDYGSVAVNTWTGVAFLVTRAPWGAAPGHTLADVGSGIGVVHNSLLFDKPHKTVVHAPFRPFPRGVRHGSLWLSPRPPWFVTNKTAAVTARRLTRYVADRKLSRLPGVFASAIRG